MEDEATGGPAHSKNLHCLPSVAEQAKYGRPQFGPAFLVTCCATGMPHLQFGRVRVIGRRPVGKARQACRLLGVCFIHRQGKGSRKRNRS